MNHAHIIGSKVFIHGYSPDEAHRWGLANVLRCRAKWEIMHRPGWQKVRGNDDDAVASDLIGRLAAFRRGPHFRRAQKLVAYGRKHGPAGHEDGSLRCHGCESQLLR